MQTSQIKKAIKTFIAPVGDSSKLTKLFSKLGAEIQENVKRTREYHETLRSLTEWMIQQSTQISDLNNTHKVDLMKFVKNTWMPLEEGHFADHIGEDGSYQSVVYQKSLPYCRSRKVAVDIGANIGLFSRPMSRDFETVHSFEPQKVVRACILRNTPNSNVVVYSFGLGNKNESLELKAQAMATGGGYIKEAPKVNSETKKTESLNSETVHIRRLDDFNFQNIDLVKIDVQGFEIDVLKGGASTFRRCKPVLILEVGGKIDEISGVNPKDALDFALQELNYKVREVVNKDYILTLD